VTEVLMMQAQRKRLSRTRSIFMVECWKIQISNVTCRRTLGMKIQLL